MYNCTFTSVRKCLFFLVRSKELNDGMNDYVNLPRQQLRNLVRRYIQFRKVADIENRMQREILDSETKTVLQKMEVLYEQVG